MWWQESAIPTLLSQDGRLRQNYPEALEPASPESITAETTGSLASRQGGTGWRGKAVPDLHTHTTTLGTHTERD